MLQRPVDLTQPLDARLPVVASDPALRLQRTRTHAADGYAVTEVTISSHAGTHMDAPFHMLPTGKTLDAYPVGKFVGEGLVLDVRAAAGAALAEERGAAIDVTDLRGAAGDAGSLLPGDIVLLWTGWDAHFGTELLWRTPWLTLEAAQFFIEAGVSVVATDAPSLDPFEGPTYPVHEMLLGADILLAENLCCLERLGPGRVIACLLPLPFTEADGSPIRALAWRL